MTLHSPAGNNSLWQRYRRLSVGIRILIWMVLGVIAGVIFGERATVVAPIGEMFIRLLIMAAVPLVFFNLVAGLTALSDLRSLGRLGARIMTFYLSTMVLALVLGLVAMNLLKPGVGMTLKGDASAAVGTVPKLADVIMDLVPQNIFKAFADGKVSQIVVFAVLLGIAALMLPAEKRAALQRMFDVLASLLRKLVEFILRAGPLGIGALAASTVGQYGAGLFGPLSKFIGGVWGAQALMAVIYLALLYAFTRIKPLDFLKRSGPLYATTAATCSTLASIVVAMDIAEKRFNIPKSIYSFTLPLGAQVNKDGTAIFLSAILLFTAQAAGVNFDWGQQVMIILVGLLLVEGSSGIPGGGLVIAFIFVKAFNLPLEIAAIVAGVYRLIDMGSTTMNCMGDLVGTALVAHFEPRNIPAIQREIPAAQS
jgi:Na+/H+-dicarboxylate symporter